MIHRGLNPDDVAFRHAHAYLDHRKVLLEQDRDVVAAAIMEVFSQ